MKYEEEATIRKVSEVERERLGEHVRVLTRRLRSAEESVLTAEVALRSERKKNAELQKLCEKIELESSSNSSASIRSVYNLARQNNINDLKEELQVTKENLENISKKREEDLDMYLKMASDSRRMFTQGLKDVFDN